MCPSRRRRTPGALSRLGIRVAEASAESGFVREWAFGAARSPGPAQPKIKVSRSTRVVLPLLIPLLVVTTVAWHDVAAARERAPNFIVIFADDLGYGDPGCFGGRAATPNIDRLAAEGVKLTSFYVPAAVCSASRAALLTGCYPQRVGILGALGPHAKIGIHPDERLLPELLRDRGYATAIFGKWHLGDAPQFLPTRHGFAEYFGLPYSNDMWPFHPTNKNYPPLPLLDGERVVEHNPDQSRLTTQYTERAVRFIEAHRERPFFLYVPHSMPHVPLFVSDQHRGQSPLGLYGDVLTEIDWSVGQILETLKRCELDEQTLVIFTSDNGPWLSYGDHAGSAGPLREGKGTTWEGGQRVPFVARWPRTLPAGLVSNQLASTMDLLPTLVKLAGGQPPPDRAIDGQDIWRLWTEPGARTPHEAFYFYWDYRLEAVRSGPWKLHFPHTFRSLKGPPGRGGQPSPYSEGQTDLALFHLEQDIGEQHNVAAQHPDVVQKLDALADVARRDLGDRLTGRTGQAIRAPGR